MCIRGLTISMNSGRKMVNANLVGGIIFGMSLYKYLGMLWFVSAIYIVRESIVAN